MAARADRKPPLAAVSTRPAKILYAGRSPYAPSGGGELSARNLLEALAKHHHLKAICIGTSGIRPCNLEIEEIETDTPAHFLARTARASPGLKRLSDRLSDELAADPPDLLLLQQPAFVLPERIPAGTKLVVFLRSPLCYNLWDPAPERWRRIASLPIFAARRKRTLPLLAHADLLITNSRYMAQELHARVGLESVPVPPLLSTSPLPSIDSRPRKLVLFSGLDDWKGAATAIAIARALPAQQFCFLEGARPDPRFVAKARELPNVRVLPWQSNMSRLYDEAKAIIIPSRWEEPFGRVAAEAAHRGVPAIARAVGGLPEAVGDGGILIDRAAPLASWVQALQGLDDASRYQHLCARALEHGGRFCEKKMISTLYRTIEMHLGVRLATEERAPREALDGGALR